MSDVVAQLENLLVGDGAANFRKLENLVDVFCPFEAIGMVGQEIRHAHFLTYVLDQNRPHGFGTTFLREFLLMIAVQKGSKLNKMDVHLMNLSNARILREWNDIDILIEIPFEKSGGIVLAIELKINASESAEQLTKYERICQEKYGDSRSKTFVFLTKRNDKATQQEWLNLGMGTLIDRFDAAFSAGRFVGKSADLFDAYIKMLRRHHLDNSEIRNLSARLWNKHHEALTILMANKPDLAQDIMDRLSEEKDAIVEAYNDHVETNGPIIALDSDTKRYIRFFVPEWNKTDGMTANSTSWVDCQSLLLVELYKGFVGDIRIAMTFDHVKNLSDGSIKMRTEIFAKLLENQELNYTDTPKKKDKPKDYYCHVYKKILWSKPADSNDFSVEEAVDIIKKSAVDYMKTVLTQCEMVINEISDN